jgi:hypothetical protein
MPEENNPLYLLSESALASGLVTPEDMKRLRKSLLELLEETTARYRFFESSSVPAELAQELYQSVIYTIGIHLKKSGMSEAVSKIINTPLYALHRAGQRDIEEQIQMGKQLLERAKLSAPKLVNRSYLDTLRALETFFQKYDDRYFAHVTPCSIDYQLCVQSTGLSGIEYICKYLRRLNIENEFLRRFDPERIRALLQKHTPDYEGLLINLYEPVFVNALGLAVIGGDAGALNITMRDRSQLIERFSALSEPQLSDTLAQAAAALCDQMHIAAIAELEYLKTAAFELLPRLKTALEHESLDYIFLTFLS